MIAPAAGVRWSQFAESRGMSDIGGRLMRKHNIALIPLNLARIALLPADGNLALR